MLSRNIRAFIIAGALSVAATASTGTETDTDKAVVRSATRQDPSRWVRQALGRGVSIRDLGEVHEATARLGHVEVIVSWDDHSTRLEVEAPRAAPAGATPPEKNSFFLKETIGIPREFKGTSLDSSFFFFFSH